MATFGELLDPAERLELAALVYSPSYLAWHFGRHCLQFYCRDEFVTLARRVEGLLRRYSVRKSATFRRRLDHLLRERGEPPIVWTEGD